MFIIEQISDENTVVSCFRYFLYYLWPRLFNVKDINVENNCTKSAYIGIIYAWNIYIKRAYIGGVYVNNTYVRNI